MANPRRNSYSNNNQSLENPFQFQFQTQSLSSLSSVKHLLKKPQALPFLLLLLLLLTWVSLRLQYSSPSKLEHWGKDDHDNGDDFKANLFRFKPGLPSAVVKDRRGWLLNPVSIALQTGVKGGAMSCAQVHIGEIQRGGVRGNHRHHTCNETFVIWGAKTKFRLENNQIVSSGYAEVTIGEDEVAVAASPSGTAHALINVDALHSTFFMGCQDSTVNSNTSNTDFTVWKDLLSVTM